jgi:hypothetical protein
MPYWTTMHDVKPRGMIDLKVNTSVSRLDTANCPFQSVVSCLQGCSMTAPKDSTELLIKQGAKLFVLKGE